MVKYPRCDICRPGSPAGHTGQTFIDLRKEHDDIHYLDALPFKACRFLSRRLG